MRAAGRAKRRQASTPSDHARNCLASPLNATPILRADGRMVYDFALVGPLRMLTEGNWRREWQSNFPPKPLIRFKSGVFDAPATPKVTPA